MTCCVGNRLLNSYGTLGDVLRYLLDLLTKCGARLGARSPGGMEPCSGTETSWTKPRSPPVHSARKLGPYHPSQHRGTAGPHKPDEKLGVLGILVCSRRQSKLQNTPDTDIVLVSS